MNASTTTHSHGYNESIMQADGSGNLSQRLKLLSTDGIPHNELAIL